MASSKQYYALCWPEAKETNDTKVAFLDLGRNEFGQALGMAVFTSKERGAALLKEEPLSSLTAGNEELEINPVSAETLLHAMQIGVPNSVFLDGHKLASSVFT